MIGNRTMKIFCVGLISLVLLSVFLFPFYRFSKLRYTICLYTSNWPTVIFLIQNGIDPLTEDGYGDNAFQRAVCDAPLDVLQELIEVGVPYNQVGSDGWHPVLIAAFQKRWDVVDWLLNLDGKIDQYVLGKLFFISIEYGKTEIVSKLIKKGVSVNSYSAEGFAPLHEVFFSLELLEDPDSLWRMIQLLLENGADVNALSHPNISTSDSCVGIRERKKPLKCSTPSAPLDLAKTINNEKVIDFLRSYGAVEAK